MMITVINTLSVNPTKVHSIFATAMKALKLKINWIFPLTSFSQKNTIFVSAVHFSYFFFIGKFIQTYRAEAALIISLN